MNAISISAAARKANVTRQAVFIALRDKRLTAIYVLERRAVKIDAKFDLFMVSTRNRKNGSKPKPKAKRRK